MSDERASRRGGALRIVAIFLIGVSFGICATLLYLDASAALRRAGIANILSPKK